MTPALEVEFVQHTPDRADISGHERESVLVSPLKDVGVGCACELPFLPLMKGVDLASRLMPDYLPGHYVRDIGIGEEA
jgi:hypothetical protein